MIRVRNVFSIDPNKMREAKAVIKEMTALHKELGGRVAGTGPTSLTDLTGEYYTLVFEADYESLAQLETALERAFADPRWQQVYGRMRPLVRGGRREIFSILS